MSWPCRLISPKPEELSQYGMPLVLNVGDMWFLPVAPEREQWIGSNYFSKWKGKRDLIAVYMPGGWIWLPDYMAYSKEQGRHGNGWNVDGEAPLITCTPSINGGIYHGYITNGVITDDCEGRKFSEDGKRML